MNNTIFQSAGKGKLVPKTDTTNLAGGKAYLFTDEHALAQYCMTGCFTTGYYTTGEAQLEKVLELCAKCSPLFIAQCAVLSRKSGFMKDMPAMLCAYLGGLKTVEATRLLGLVFPVVMDNFKMIRNFAQIVRSGVTGRKSFGSALRNMIRTWIDARSMEGLFRDDIGEKPSMKDILVMVRPCPKDASREALYGYLMNYPGVSAGVYEVLTVDARRKVYNHDVLPELVQHYLAYKAGDNTSVPNVPFQMLASLGLGTSDWVEIARNAPWHMCRMNLNTFKRHGVFDTAGMDKVVAAKLNDKEAVLKSKVFPYQLLVAYRNTTDIPVVVRNALQHAMEHAIGNIPAFDGVVAVCPDTSGSMTSPVTGVRGTATTSVRCIDVAALVAASVMRRNENAIVLPFDTSVHLLDLNSMDTVITNAAKLARLGGGGTDCSQPLSWLNEQKKMVDLVIIVSDNESWITQSRSLHIRGTGVMDEWKILKQRCPKAKLVCIDITPNQTTQAKEQDDILNIGGWSDTMFTLIASFAQGSLGTWVDQIEQVRV